VLQRRRKRFGRGSLGAILRLVGDEVSSPSEQGNLSHHLLCCQGRHTLLFLSVAQCSTELGSLSPLLWVPTFPLYPEEGGYKAIWGYGLWSSCAGV
jgi:hypothetical protein